MTISERILKVLKDRNMTQVEFAKQVGIATSTISEWKKKKTNPYDIQLVQDYHGLKEEQQKRLMAYVEALKKIESLENM